MDADLPSHDHVEAALARCAIGVDAAELHGLMAGFLAAGGSLQGDDWLGRLHIEAEQGLVQRNTVLQRLHRATQESFDDDDLGFDLLLPDKSASVPERVQAMLAWCRGFLSGFALAPSRVPLGEEAQEAFADLSRIASFSVDDDEQDEAALMDITEFVRVAVLLIHAGRAQGLDGSGERLH